MDKPLTAREFEDIMRRAGMLGGGGGMRRATRGGGNEGDALNEQLEGTAESLRNFLSVQKEYTKRHQAGSFVAGLFGKTTDAAQRNMGQLRNAISQHERMLEELTEQGHTATSAQYKKVQADLKTLQSQEAMYAAQTTGAEIIRNASGQVFGAFLKLVQVQADYQANLLNIVSQGGSGFQMAAAAMENSVNQMHAMQSTMASIAQSAGQSLGQLGGKFAPLAGMALGALGQAAQAAADAQRTLAMAQIRIMAQEGDKLIKTHMGLTGSGVIFQNGMKGLIDATSGTKLRLEEMQSALANNRDALIASGLGQAEAARRVGAVAKIFASSSGSMAKMDRQLLALGFSYEEQAGLAAEVLGQMRRGKDGQAVSNQAVAQATAEYAKNLTTLKNLSDGDVKAKLQQRKQENMQLAFEMKMAGMDPAQRAQIELAMSKMTDQEAKNFRERMVFGKVINRAGAVLEAQIPAAKAQGEAYFKAAKEGKLNVDKVAAIQAQHSKEYQAQVKKNGEGIARAGMAGVGNVEEITKAVADGLRTAQGTTEEAVQASKEAREKQAKEAKTEKPGDPTSLLLTAVEKGAIAAKNLQEEVIKRLPKLASALEQAYKDAMATLRGEGGGGPGGILAKILEYLPILTAALTALTLAQQIFPGKLSGIFAKLKGAPPGMPGSDKPGMFQSMKEKFFPDKRSAYDKHMDEMNRKNSPTKLQKITDGMGKFGTEAMSKLGTVGNLLAKGAKFLGPVAALGAAAYSGFQGYQNTAANFDLKEGEEATTGQKVSSTLAGVTSGLTFGLLDEKMLAQGFQNINLKVQESWGQMTTSLGAWTADLSKSISSAWSASSTYISGKWQEVGNWAKKSTDEFLAAHPKLAEAVAKFPKSFDEAGRLAKNFIGDTQAKFKSEFPKLYANLESTFKTVGTFMSGMMDSVGSKLKDAKNYLAEKLGFTDRTQPATANVANPAAAQPNTASASRPVTTTEFNDADKKNIQSWVEGVNSGKYSLNQVPAVYRAEVAKMVKARPGKQTDAKPADSKPAAKPAEAKPEQKTSARTDGKPVQGTPTNAPGTAPPTRVTLGSMPQKGALTAAEKANAMETVAGNTKYTNDLLIASQKNLENLNKIMIQKLDSIVSATEAAAGYGKKTARNTS